ncbi:MAG: ATP-binding cassette domain-containing protein [Ruminococcaceae bacterium]|nr:ATP-binding cassette domain-containing protein [Oscillospiraceae bacterium]
MLETKNLVKIYKPKKGVPVTALDGVNLKFNDKGMVFLLGKSGSGKSTLLNVLGGLDSYEKGEIIIKGVSSKKFRQKHFDSYRNTYVGFIFQEYNVLDEFTVGANIALAIELQNRKATDEEINNILKQVDLEGYALRKPNELSGGQKQRVAIARALVKNPQIIMADEPTGALDSVTGRQIFETLKKLSKEKLVIVVSHDREFAENYADRIIELADGKVISDLELDNEYKESEDTLEYNGNVIEVPAGYHLTEEDRKQINEYISSLNSTNAKISISKGSKAHKFKATDISKIKLTDSSAFKLIKSKLPLKSAFKIGASGLKYKKFRLVITILLCCISFGLFGLSDTFGAYNHIEVCTNSLVDSKVDYISTVKSIKVEDDDYSYWMSNGYLSESDLADFKTATNIKMHGVYFPIGGDLSFNSQRNPEIELTETDFEIYNTYFSGFAEINQSIIDEMNFSLLAGTLPDGTKDEIAISEYIFSVFQKANYTDGSLIKDANGKEVIDYKQINAYSDILGKKIKLDNKDYTVTAIVDTNFDIERYIPLTVKKENKTNAEELLDYALLSEFSYASESSFAGLAMVGEGYIDKLIAESPKISHITKGYIYFNADNYGVDSNYLAKLSDLKDEKIIWLDGQKDTLGEKEIIATTDSINFYGLESELGDEVFTTEEEYYKILLKKAKSLTIIKDFFADTDVPISEDGYKVVGFIVADPMKTKINSTVVCSDNLFSEFADGPENRYSFCVGSMPKEKQAIKNMVEFCYREDADIRYEIQNSVTYELDALNDVLKTLSSVFLYIGLGFALFSAIMFANFIATSISYKKQEIGILRAIGSRSNDVFRIFFAESFIIAIINFLLSATGVGVATAIINHVFRNEMGILITVLTFNLRQVLLLLAVSILVAFISSYIPVKKIAAKKPIDAIRDR